MSKGYPTPRRRGRKQVKARDGGVYAQQQVIFEAGEAARQAGLAVDANPHREGSAAYAWWRAGWGAANLAEQAKGQEGGGDA